MGAREMGKAGVCANPEGFPMSEVATRNLASISISRSETAPGLQAVANKTKVNNECFTIPALVVSNLREKSSEARQTDMTVMVASYSFSPVSHTTIAPHSGLRKLVETAQSSPVCMEAYWHWRRVAGTVKVCRK